MDAKLTVFFDGDDSLCFVQGEDRSVVVCFFDAAAGRPLDLTGASVSLSMPGALDGVVRRSSAPLLLTPASITPGAPGSINAPDHGLVTGDVVQFTGSSLPAPLVAGTAYTVLRIDADNLQLAGVALTSTGSGTFTLASQSVAIGAVPQAGVATFALSAFCTAAVATGQAQALQADVVTTGKRRISVMPTALNVVAQPEP